MRTVLLLFLFLYIFPCMAQLPTRIFNGSSMEMYRSADFKQGSMHTGVYHFGESEGEWDLLIIPFGDRFIVQYCYGAWEKSYYTRELVWVRKYSTFNLVDIEGDQFSFGGHTARFMLYRNTTKAVLLNADPLNDRLYGKDSTQAGFYASNFESWFDSPELYELSLELHSPQYFSKKSTRQLKIMRNTLFAKYGQIFLKGGEMDAYFKKKEWYEPFIQDASGLLTDIERTNLDLLTKEEKSRE